jgi:hypothetical protein
MRPTSKLLSLYGQAYWSPTRTLLEHLGLLCLLGAIAAILSVELSAQNLKEGEPVVTITDAYWVKVRSKPELLPENVITKVPGGSQLRFSGKVDDWYRVELTDGSNGWINDDYAIEDYARTQLEVSVSAARLRAAADVDSPSIVKVPGLTRLHVLDEEENWFHVLAPYGEQGWIRKDLVVLRQVDPSDTSPKSAPPIEALAAPTDAPYSGAEVVGGVPASTKEPDISRQVSGFESTRKSQFPLSNWVPRKPEALLVSFVVGVSMFIVLSLIGALILFQRNLSQLKSKLPPEEDTIEELRLQPSLSLEVSDLTKATEAEIRDLDTAIDRCLQTLRKTADPNTGPGKTIEEDELAGTVRRQQQQILHYLELISLQNRKLKTYHRETESVRNMIRKLSSTPHVRNVPSSYDLAAQAGKLSILPA